MALVGQNQRYYQDWHSLKSVYHFALSLPSTDKQAFLIVFSATCWTVWKHRNDICFQHVPQKTVRSILYLILSLVFYWTGNSRVKHKVREAIHRWLPETMDAIPLRVIWSGEEASESFLLPADQSSTESADQ